jgi:flavodoxin
MKILVIYDSKYGNTEMVAKVIGEAIEGQVLHIGEVCNANLRDYELVIIGSPTHGGWFTEGIKQLFEDTLVLKGINAAVFDTRTKRSLFGFAAPRMAQRLEKKGGTLLAPPEGFIVLGIEGPLKDGELERAGEWVKDIVNRSATTHKYKDIQHV